MGSKKQVFITKLLHFDEDKFESHIKKRKSEKLIENEADYIEIIEDVLYNFDRVFYIAKTRNNDQLSFIKSKSGWLLGFTIKDFKIHTCLKIHDFFTIEEYLEHLKKSKKDIETYKEVNYEKSEFQRIIKRVQEKIK